MLRYLLAAALTMGGPAFAAAPAVPASRQPAPPSATPPAAPERWRIADQRVAFLPAGVSFPLRAGGIDATSHSELSNEGAGIDNAIQYRNEAGDVFATVYIYRTGLSHAGVAAYVTDFSIMTLGGETVRARGERRIVGAGGAREVAIRQDYSGCRGNMASSAAFIKSGAG